MRCEFNIRSKQAQQIELIGLRLVIYSANNINHQIHH